MPGNTNIDTKNRKRPNPIITDKYLLKMLIKEKQENIHKNK
tara:strand:+ start:408 stop:530 length:123 start_codon:yes stop_codon:yes gene_type:complete